MNVFVISLSETVISESNPYILIVAWSQNLQLPGLLTIGSPGKPSQTGLLNNSITIGSPV